MSRLNHLLWPKTPAIWSYGTAVLSVLTAAAISLWPPFHLQSAPASLFLCAVLVSAWFGGSGPGLLATALSALAFYYYFLHPIHSLAAKPGEIPRFAIFIVAALFVEWLSAAQRRNTESLKRARDDLKVRVHRWARVAGREGFRF
jgi:K+-sensing histidine kinase KdpD